MSTMVLLKLASSAFLVVLLVSFPLVSSAGTMSGVAGPPVPAIPHDSQALTDDLADHEALWIRDLIRIPYGRDSVVELPCCLDIRETYVLHMALWEIYGGRLVGMGILDVADIRCRLRNRLKARRECVDGEVSKLDEQAKAEFVRDASDYLVAEAGDWLSTSSLTSTDSLYAALYDLYKKDDWKQFEMAVREARRLKRGEEPIVVLGCVPLRFMVEAEKLSVSLPDLDGVGSEIADDNRRLFGARRARALYHAALIKAEVTTETAHSRTVDDLKRR